MSVSEIGRPRALNRSVICAVVIALSGFRQGLAEDGVSLKIVVQASDSAVQRDVVEFPTFAIWAHRKNGKPLPPERPQPSEEEVQATFAFGPDFTPEVKVVRVPATVRIVSSYASTVTISTLSLRNPPQIIPLLESGDEGLLSIRDRELAPITIYAEGKGFKHASGCVAIEHSLFAVTDRAGRATLRLPSTGTWKFCIATTPLKVMRDVTVQLNGNPVASAGILHQVDLPETQATLKLKLADTFVELP